MNDTHLSKLCPGFFLLHPTMEDQIVKYLPSTCILHYQVQCLFCFYYLRKKSSILIIATKNVEIYKKIISSFHYFFMRFYDFTWYFHYLLHCSVFNFTVSWSVSVPYSTDYQNAYPSSRLSPRVTMIKLWIPKTTYLEEFDDVRMIKNFHDSHLSK